jgi:hypothetical protein
MVSVIVKLLLLNLVDGSAEPRSFSFLASHQVIDDFFDFCSFHRQR